MTRVTSDPDGKAEATVELPAEIFDVAARTSR